MFRWPVEISPLSLGSGGRPRSAHLEITPRGALFTLAALSQVGHPAHVALIDAYLKGQVRQTATVSIGEDSRIVAASLAAPLLAALELGIERLRLSDLILLPRDESVPPTTDRSADGQPVHTADSPRFLLRNVRAGQTWQPVQTAERFEVPGCLGTSDIGQGDAWYRAVAELRLDGQILAEVREPTVAPRAVTETHLRQIRSQALARFARAPLGADRALTTERDGYQTLCLLPSSAVDAADPAELVDPPSIFALMRDRAWNEIEQLIGRPLPERRTEPIELRLIAQDGRTATLDVGVSVVIGRNQTVFAAWVGSDGRVMLRLFPPGGMRAG